MSDLKSHLEKQLISKMMNKWTEIFMFTFIKRHRVRFEAQIWWNQSAGAKDDVPKTYLQVCEGFWGSIASVKNTPKPPELKLSKRSIGTKFSNMKIEKHTNGINYFSISMSPEEWNYAYREN